MWLVGLLGLVVAAIGCGASGSNETYQASDIQRAFTAAGIASHVVFSPAKDTTTLPFDSDGLLARQLVGRDVVAMVAGSQRASRNRSYDVYAFVLGSAGAAEHYLRQEGAGTCLGRAFGRAGNVFVQANSPGYLNRIRTALADLRRHGKSNAAPASRITIRCLKN